MSVFNERPQNVVSHDGSAVLNIHYSVTLRWMHIKHIISTFLNKCRKMLSKKMSSWGETTILDSLL